MASTSASASAPTTTTPRPTAAPAPGSPAFSLHARSYKSLSPSSLSRSSTSVSPPPTEASTPRGTPPRIRLVPLDRVDETPTMDRLTLTSRSVSPFDVRHPATPPMSLWRKRFSPPLKEKPRATGHRRAFSLSQLNSTKGYLLLPRSDSPPSGTAHNKRVIVRGLPTAPSFTGKFDSRLTPARHRSDPRSKSPPTPFGAHTSTHERLMLLNPQVAAHLRSGGAVSMKSADGMKSWKIYLPPTPKTAKPRLQ